jgi:hypothetical protein
VFLSKFGAHDSRVEWTEVCISIANAVDCFYPVSRIESTLLTALSSHRACVLSAMIVYLNS